MTNEIAGFKKHFKSLLNVNEEFVSAKEYTYVRITRVGYRSKFIYSFDCTKNGGKSINFYVYKKCAYAQNILKPQIINIKIGNRDVTFQNDWLKAKDPEKQHRLKGRWHISLDKECTPKESAKTLREFMNQTMAMVIKTVDGK